MHLTLILMSWYSIVNLHNGLIQIITRNTPWPSKDRRIASVNSFGYGGANAHVILESIDSYLPSKKLSMSAERLPCQQNGLNPTVRHKLDTRETSDEIELHSSKNQYLIVFSAHSAPSLQNNIDALTARVGKWDLKDLAYTLSARRSMLAERCYAVASTDTLMHPPGLQVCPPKRINKSKDINLAFVLTGKLFECTTSALFDK